MPQANVIPARLAVCGSGQSLNEGILDALADIRQVARYTTAVAGMAWLQCVTRTAWLTPLSKTAQTNVLLMVGGTTDYNFARTGAQCVADQVTYATAAKAAGFGYVIGTTTTPSTNIVGSEETERTTGNASLLATYKTTEISSKVWTATTPFDYLIDFAGHTSLDDATDGTWYSDGTHPTTAGYELMATLVATVLDDI